MWSRIFFYHKWHVLDNWKNLSQVCRLQGSFIKYSVPVLIIKLVYERGLFLFSETYTLNYAGIRSYHGEGNGNSLHPVFLPRESPWMKGPGGLQFMQLQSQTRQWLNTNPRSYHVLLSNSWEWWRVGRWNVNIWAIWVNGIWDFLILFSYLICSSVIMSK